MKYDIEGWKAYLTGFNPHLHRSRDEIRQNRENQQIFFFRYFKECYSDFVMENVQTIYQQTILPLPNSEKIRLAALILQNLSNSEIKTQTAYDLLQNLPNNSVFSNAQEVEDHLKSERESWDN